MLRTGLWDMFGEEAVVEVIEVVKVVEVIEVGLLWWRF